MTSPLAHDENHFYRPWFLFPNARSAFKAFLKDCALNDQESILLPAYIGWSSREGSGVFDPIAELGLHYSFYRLNSQLHIDLDDYRHAFKSVKVVVIIHYFGYVDPQYEAAVAIAKENGALVLEDEAHALFTDLVGGKSGRLGDACIFSLHKMLPMSSGGMLMLNTTREYPHNNPSGVSPWAYDFPKIAQKRRANALLLSRLLQRLEGKIDSLWSLSADEVPQTYPVLVRTVSRDQLYFAMREAGFGVVSLYHTLIHAIDEEKYPASHHLSRTIFNLPVHQDVDEAGLESMVEKLDECIRLLGGS